MLTSNNFQLQALRLYGELICRGESYGGQLIFTSAIGCSASGLPAAVSIDEVDAATVKAVFRQGGVDFVVNTLDEALRVLKNEIRQHRPLGVALIADIEPSLAEMAERGVLPDLHVSIDATSESPGRHHLHLTTNEGIAEPTPLLANWLHARNWSETIQTATPETPLRTLDAQLLAALPPKDTHRRLWLQRISHYQRPTLDGSRVFWADQTP
jgi:hypothetical protein